VPYCLTSGTGTPLQDTRIPGIAASEGLEDKEHAVLIPGESQVVSCQETKKTILRLQVQLPTFNFI